MASHLAILLRVRREVVRNRLADRSGAAWLATVMVGGAAAAVIVYLGHLAAPGLMEPPTDLATPRLGDHPAIAGESALEAAFWITALACAVVGFRMMEAIFRREDVRVLERLPVSPGALFVERTLTGIGESLIVAAPIALFFVPMFWHGGTLVGAAAIGLDVSGLVATTFVAIGVNVFMGAQYGAPQKRSMVSDAYGGQGQVFIFSPAVALGGSVVALLLLQLAFAEILKSGQITNAFWLGAGIAAAIALGALLTGCREFLEDYFRVFAFFNEAETVGYEAVMDYQRSRWDEAPRGVFTAGANAVVEAVYGRTMLQYTRRFMLLRYLYVIIGLGGAIAAATLSREAFPDWAVCAVSVAVFGVVANLWTRARHDDLAPDAYRGFPVSDAEETAGLVRAILREMAPFTVTWAVAATSIRIWRFDDLAAGTMLLAGAAALVAPLGIAGLMAALRSLGVGWSRAVSVGVPLAASVALVGAAILDLRLALAIGAGLTAGHVPAFVTGHAGGATSREAT